MSVPSHEGWIEKQIREATERGEFDDLPGAGEPLRGIDDHDPDWWIKRMMAREGLDMSDALPPPMQLRREHATFPESLVEISTEDGVRAVLRDYNQRVAAERRRPLFDKSFPVFVPLADVDALVDRWWELRDARAPEPPEGAVEPPPSPRRSWWRRLLRR